MTKCNISPHYHHHICLPFEHLYNAHVKECIITVHLCALCSLDHGWIWMWFCTTFVFEDNILHIWAKKICHYAFLEREREINMFQYPCSVVSGWPYSIVTPIVSSVFYTHFLIWLCVFTKRERERARERMIMIMRKRIMFHSLSGTDEHCLSNTFVIM